MEVRIRDAEGCDDNALLLWDSVWVQRLDAGGGYADWIVADADEKGNAGGLRARAALHTATLLLIFTDRRLDDDEATPDDSGDPRGWWGDSVKLPGEPDEPQNSLLWTLERGVLNDESAFLAKDYCEDSLHILKDQGAVARSDVETAANVAAGRLEIMIRHYDRSGGEIYAQMFDVIWDQETAPAQMNYGDQGVFV